MSSQGTIARNAAVIAGATLASRILGFVRDTVLAYVLGAGLVSDAFYVAFRIPNLLRRLFAEGSLTMSFIPVFTRTMREQGREAAFATARSAQAWLVVILAGITVLAVVFAEPLVQAIAPGFAAKPEQMELTVRLVRITFPYILFVSAVALCMGILNSLGHFLSPALSPCLLNIGMLASGLIGYFGGMNVAVAVSWGVLAAGVAQWLAQQPFLRPHGFSWRGAWSFRDAGARRIGRLMLPTVFGAAIYQVNILLSTLLVSFLPAGSVTFLYYADRLVEFPLGVFGLAVSTAALPNLSQLASERRDADFAAALRHAISLTLFIGIPAMAGLMALSEPVVALLFGRGAFTPEAVSATSKALLAYSLGLPFTAVARPMASAFYALENTRAPVYAALASMVVNIGLGALLMGPLAHVGLAVAVAVSCVVNALFLGVLITRRLGRCPVDWKVAGKCLALAALMGLGAHATAGNRWVWIPMLPVWAVLYFAAARLIGMEEARLLWGGLERRLRRRN